MAVSEYQFNLLDEPWIPCMLIDGTVRELGLRAALAQAATIRDIVDPSPLVTATLHRLLLAVLHRNLGPKSSAAWAALWERGAFDMSVFDAYFAQWRTRFDLFDADYPFYQWPGLDFANLVPAAKLTHELAAGNNATLFDHTTERTGTVFTPGQAARYLVAQQSYALSGTVSLVKNEDPGRHYADAAPLARGAMALVRGSSLFETLMLNLHHYDPRHDKPFPVPRGAVDLPAWERQPPSTIEERRPTGYLDYLTWQSRRIRLYPERDPSGAIIIRRAVIMKGNKFPGSWYERPRAELLQAFRKLEKAQVGQDPWLPVGFREDRALWRDSLAFMRVVQEVRADDPQVQRPRIFDWLSELVEEGYIAREQTLPIDLYGFYTKEGKAKVLFWRHERQAIPMVYLKVKPLRDTLAEALAMAEEVGRVVQENAKRAVKGSVRELARLLLAPDADRPDGRKPHPEDERRLADSLAPGRVYWSRLEVPFRAFMIALAESGVPDEYGEVRYGQKELPAWADMLRTTAWGAFDDMVRGLDGSARSLKAIARARAWFARNLAKALKQ